MAKQEGEKKEGVSVKEIEHFGKKYRFQIFFCIVFVLASFFSSLFFGVEWSIYLAGLGAIIAVWIPKHIGKAILATFRFCFKQEKATRIIIACIGIILSIFLPPLIFLCIGFMAGKGFHSYGHQCCSNQPPKPDEHKEQ